LRSQNSTENIDRETKYGIPLQKEWREFFNKKLEPRQKTKLFGVNIDFIDMHNAEPDILDYISSSDALTAFITACNNVFSPSIIYSRSYPKSQQPYLMLATCGQDSTLYNIIENGGRVVLGLAMATVMSNQIYINYICTHAHTKTSAIKNNKLVTTNQKIRLGYGMALKLLLELNRIYPQSNYAYLIPENFGLQAYYYNEGWRMITKYSPSDSQTHDPNCTYCRIITSASRKINTEKLYYYPYMFLRSLHPSGYWDSKGNRMEVRNLKVSLPTMISGFISRAVKSILKSDTDIDMLLDKVHQRNCSVRISGHLYIKHHILEFIHDIEPFELLIYFIRDNAIKVMKTIGSHTIDQSMSHSQMSVTCFNILCDILPTFFSKNIVFNMIYPLALFIFSYYYDDNEKIRPFLEFKDNALDYLASLEYIQKFIDTFKKNYHYYHAQYVRDHTASHAEILNSCATFAARIIYYGGQLKKNVATKDDEDYYSL
jgi:hypothetical protein